MKEQLKIYLAAQSHRLVDMGNAAYDADDDYSDFAKAVAERVVGDTESRGILICGSGAGVAIAANKVRGIRAATIVDSRQAQMARSDEDINILALPADFIDEQKAREIVDVFLGTPFSAEERHIRRLKKIE